jgi:uncharacterized NAD-dependent epimerase/dehydratase family protein
VTVAEPVVIEERLASLRDVFAEDPRPAWEHVHELEEAVWRVLTGGTSREWGRQASLVARALAEAGIEVDGLDRETLLSYRPEQALAIADAMTYQPRDPTKMTTS